MTFFKDLDTIMKQDFGNRGLLKALPDNPIQETLNTLADPPCHSLNRLSGPTQRQLLCW
jgi:hypothetical protein